MDMLDGIDQIGQSFQCVILALHGNNNPVCRTESIQCQERQGWWTIDQNEIILFSDRIQRFFQTLVTTIHIDHFHFRTGQFTIGRQNLIISGRGLLQNVFHVGQSKQYFIYGCIQLRFLDTASHCRISLGIQINKKDSLIQSCKTCCQIDSRRRFADSSFLIGNAEYGGHKMSFLQVNSAINEHERLLLLSNAVVHPVAAPSTTQSDLFSSLNLDYRFHLMESIPSLHKIFHLFPANDWKR